MAECLMCRLLFSYMLVLRLSHHADFHTQDVRSAYRLISEGDKSEEEKRRQMDAVNAVSAYCNNDVECRRVQVLNYFGQSFDPKECGRQCNNCVQNKDMTEEDLTLYAKDALNLVAELVNGRDRVTQNYCVMVYRGSKIKEIMNRGHNTLPLFGVGKHLEKTKTDRMFGHLITINALRLESVSNAQGWNNVYLQASQFAPIFLRLCCHFFF